MSVSEATSALRRKAAVGRQEYQARAMTAARALRLSVPKAAEDLFEMALAVIGLTQRTLPQEEAMELVQDGSMMLLLDAPKRRTGAVVVDSALAGALVQQQTMGQVFKSLDDDTSRAPTRTEAMLFAPLLDRLLLLAAKMPEVEDDKLMLTDLRFGAWVESRRLVDIALDEASYEHFSLTIDVEGGTRQGRCDLFLPLPGAVPEDIELEEMPTAPLADLTMELPVVLNVALARFDMSLAAVSELSPGDVLPIASDAFDRAEILSITGEQVGLGTLGQVDGKRAVRPVLPEILQTPQRRSTDPAAEAPEFSALGDGAAAAAVAAPAAMAAMGGETIDMPPALPDMDAPSDLPALPGAGVDDLPGLPDVAEGLPDMPGDLPDMGGDLPDLPGELPDMPGDLPDLASETALPDLPGDSDPLSDLPDLSDLPELSDL